MDRPSLASYFWAGTIEESIKRPLLGKSYVPFIALVSIGQWVFQSGALLGRARRDKTLALATLLSQPGMAASFQEFLLHASEKRVTARTSPLTSFTDLFLVTEFENAGVTFGDLPQMKKLTNVKIPLDQAGQLLTLWTAEGVSFGIAHPEDAERMWRTEFEQHDPDAWRDAREHGLDIPEEFTPLPLEEREAQVLLITASYVAEFFPELLDENLRP